jgi:hypothetical protein
MKHIFKKIALICVLALVLCFGACEPVGNSGEEAKEISVSLTVSYTGYEKTFNASGKFATVEDVMQFLAQGEEFTFTASEGDYGSFITEVCGYAVSGNEFWGIYTDTITNDSNGLPNVFEEYTTVVGGKTYYSCTQGVSGQKVYNGENVLLIVGSF